MKKILSRILKNKYLNTKIFNINHRLSKSISRENDRIGFQIAKENNFVITYGIFKNMSYNIPHGIGSSLLPKLFGTYEAELHPVLQELKSKQYDQVVIVGAGEGYYTVGLARLFKGTPILSYEENELGRKICKDLAHQNGVTEQIDIRGRCTETELAKDLHKTKRNLLICDCEGFEFKLLNNEILKYLFGTDVILETHDYKWEGKTAMHYWSDYFRESHHIIPVNERYERHEAHIPELKGLPYHQRKLFLDEGRTYSSGWIVGLAKSNKSNTNQ